MYAPSGAWLTRPHTLASMDFEDVELLDKNVTHRGYFRTLRYRLRHRRFDGSMSPVLEREVFDRGPVVAVLPVDVVRDEVILIEQFRPGAYAAGWAPWMMECVAGVVEAGESAEAVARRESVEECGCSLGALHRVAAYLSSPGSSTEAVTVFCGQADTSGAGGVHGLEAEGEDIRVQVLPVDAALELVPGGRILNAKTVIVLQWLALNYSWLKAQWS